MDGNATTSAPASLPLSRLRVWPGNPRRTVPDLTTLTESVRKVGVLAPLLVRELQLPVGDVTHEVIAGQCRYLAATAAGLAEVPVTVREVDDATALELGLTENAQRNAPAPMEEAEALDAAKAFHELREGATPEAGAPDLDVNAFVRDLRAAQGRASEAARALRAALDESEEEARAAELAHLRLSAERDRLAAERAEARARLDALNLAVSDRAEALRRVPAATLRAHLAERSWELAGRQNTLDGSPKPEHWHWTKAMPAGILASRLDVILCDGATTAWGSVATVGEIEERAPELVLAELVLRAAPEAAQPAAPTEKGGA